MWGTVHSAFLRQQCAWSFRGPASSWAAADWSREVEIAMGQVMQKLVGKSEGYIFFYEMLPFIVTTIDQYTGILRKFVDWTGGETLTLYHLRQTVPSHGYTWIICVTMWLLGPLTHQNLWRWSPRISTLKKNSNPQNIWLYMQRKRVKGFIPNYNMNLRHMILVLSRNAIKNLTF